jgi:hypothetical membrane protein
VIIYFSIIYTKIGLLFFLNRISNDATIYPLPANILKAFNREYFNKQSNRVVAMPERMSASFGIAAVVTLYASISASILLSPWFSWINNALSDLGNVGTSSAADVFNVGLLLAGLFTILYSVLSLRSQAPVASYFLAFTGFSLQLVGALNETYGGLHFDVSVILFVSLLASSLVYLAERRSPLALIALIGIIPWVMVFQNVVFVGEAIPEIISSLVVMPWIISTIVKALRYKKIET